MPSHREPPCAEGVDPHIEGTRSKYTLKGSLPPFKLAPRLPSLALSDGVVKHLPIIEFSLFSVVPLRHRSQIPDDPAIHFTVLKVL